MFRKKCLRRLQVILNSRVSVTTHVNFLKILNFKNVLDALNIENNTKIQIPVFLFFSVYCVDCWVALFIKGPNKRPSFNMCDRTEMKQVNMMGKMTIVKHKLVIKPVI